MAPLVSVITPTWGRHRLLTGRCMPSVQAQDYGHVEHIIVSDGPDSELRDMVNNASVNGVPVRYLEMPEHDPGVRWGVRARLAGLEVARGEYVAWLDDDNSFRPQHVRKLAGLLDDGARFAYSLVLFHSQAGLYPVGSDPPSLGQIDTSAIANRRDLHEVATWRDEGQQTIEWDLVERWMGAGASWAFDPEITADYYFAGCI